MLFSHCHLHFQNQKFPFDYNERGGCGAPVYDDSGRLITTHKQTLVHDRNGRKRDFFTEYDIFFDKFCKYC